MGSMKQFILQLQRNKTELESEKADLVKRLFQKNKIEEMKALE